MQVKTIGRNIENKIKEWIGTIEDVNLKKKILENVMVSGGCIASMLLKEEVRDYDVYFKDIDVLEATIKYYIDKFKQEEDIIVLNGRLKSELLNRIFSDNKSSYLIAISNLHPDQIRLFFNKDKHKGGKRIETDEIVSSLQISIHPGQLLSMKNEEIKKATSYVPLFFSPNSITLSGQIQIVTRFTGDNISIHKNFDFVHATNYWTNESGLVINKDALESLLTKQLKYQGSLYPLTSIIRMKKFINRKWNISAGEILKIMFQISELDLKNSDILEEQLIGVDVAYFSKLIAILRGVQKDKLVSSYLNEIIDRVFNLEDDCEEV